MPAATSPWRVNDVVTYDRMREAAIHLTALLAAVARADDPAAGAARDELTALHREVHAVDAFDRAAVAALAERIDGRIRELDRVAR
ncbi:hypothetical protein [Microbacterium trichothecenolyticum]|uniref:Uncharacterized protein n=1 Tax=Microbacterium trichothecenolyticum TaxID=69370 RepID=A0A0M2HLJ3_MICTR|nr:hypothetical protein [Microbacterium trichothecenolyticum]KJL45768.1 hypothetical protein RS82_00048 [Microbacterium trichothecenolyticum]